jgi:uncharacterized membrane protein YsdA (DUF1294 family)/cold shock CspA family protein
MSMRFDGTLNSWNDDRGFGFIQPVQGGEPIFVHIQSFPARSGRPQLNQAISFEVEVGPKGKRARNVQYIRTRPAPLPQRRLRAQWGTATLFALPAFLLVYLVIAVLWRPPAWFAAVYAGASLVTFVAYYRDKVAAINQRLRTREDSLHLLALLGGWPGALVAQQVLGHKSTKQEFRKTFWATVGLNVVGFALVCSPLGRQVWAQ